MEIEIIRTPLTLSIYGFGGIAVSKEYGAMAFKLSGKMWEIVQKQKIKNKGNNIWVYEDQHKVFAGVELDQDYDDTDLEHKVITLNQYAYYKYVGPWRLIPQAGQKMTEELKSKGIETKLPYIEIYGHWVKDENLQESELLTVIR